MPEIHYYTVTREQTVKVRANSAADAVQLAAAAYEHGQNQSEPTILVGKGPEGIWGNTISRIETVDYHCRQEGK